MGESSIREAMSKLVHGGFDPLDSNLDEKLSPGSLGLNISSSKGCEEWPSLPLKLKTSVSSNKVVVVAASVVTIVFEHHL